MYQSICLGIVVVAALMQLGWVQDYICDDTAANNKVICECTEEICYFKLVIEHLQTFTAYEKNAARGTRGRIYYIDDNGELVATTDRRNACDDISNCTEVNTVDGYTYRSFIAVNKQLPGPILKVLLL